MKPSKRIVISFFLTLVAMSTSVLAGPVLVQGTQTAAAHAAPKYPTVSMHGGKAQQDKSSGIIYLNATQREERRLVIHDGLVYDHAGKTPITTRSKHRNQNNYVMDSEGHFYLFDEFTHPEIRHSSIFAGGPVAGAGNIAIEQGHITYIDADSGHYDSARLQRNVLKELATLGVTVGAHSASTDVAKSEKSKEGKSKDKKSKKKKKDKKQTQ